MNAKEVWQEVNCPQHDYDIQGDDMVYIGMKFNCLACGGEHIAADDLISTFTDVGGEMFCIENPRTLGQLGKLKGAE